MPVGSNVRVCGGCTLCCFTHGVKDDDGSVVTGHFEWCAACTIGTGCAIYEKRPLVCKKWSCAWRLGEGEADERPDKTHIVLAWKYTRLKMTMYMTAATPDALDSEYAKRVTREFTDNGHAVVREDTGGRKELVLPMVFYLREDDKQEALDGGLTIVRMD